MCANSGLSEPGKLETSISLVRNPPDGSLSFSGRHSADALPRFHIPHRRLAEEAAILAVELAGALIAYFKGRARRVQPFGDHPSARRVQPQPLLILQRTHRGQRAKVMVQGRDAHLRDRRKFFDAQRLGVVRS